jgi:antitoxin Phd
MLTISATDAKQKLATWLDTVQREPVMIRRQKRDVAVLLSPEAYDRLRGLKIAEFERFCERVGTEAMARGLNETILNEILADED